MSVMDWPRLLAEAAGLLGQAARRPLVEVVMAVDEPRRGQAAAGVDAAGAPGRRRRRRPRADGGDPARVDDHVAVRVLRAVGVEPMQAAGQ